MTPRERETRAAAVFEAAIQIADEAERGRFVDRACAGDAALQQRVLALLAAHDLPGFHTGPAAASDDPDLAPGEQVGEYVIEGTLGAGGHGRVYVARQAMPGAPRVALKLLTTRSTASLAARFEAERAVLSKMQHPHIAQVFHAGTTDRDVPFIAMELVAERTESGWRSAPSITAYADAKRLDLDARLALWTDAAAAVAHAHDRAVIHRDLKPSNILVTEIDGRPAVKVIDFGIAKVLEGPEPNPALTTEHTFLGTPRYMSPEQARGGASASVQLDVYALGVVLFELLVGRTPLDPDEGASGSLLDELRRAAESDRPKPSAALRAAEARDRTAARRGLSYAALDRALRPELDIIASTAIHADPAKRYASVRDLMEDVDRFRTHRPIVAGPDAVGDRVKKFIRRNRVASAIGASVLLGLIGTVAALVWALQTRGELARKNATLDRTVGALNEKNAELDLNNRRLARIKKHQNERLDDLRIAGVTETMRKALVESFRREQANPLRRADAPPPNDELIRELERADLVSVARRVLTEHFFKPGESRIANDFAEDPLTRAELLRALGQTVYKNALFASSARCIEAALAIYEAELGPSAAKTLDVCHDLGVLYRAMGQVEKSRAVTERAVEAAERTHGPHHRHTIRSINSMGTLLAAEGKFDEAIEWFERALSRSREAFGPNDEDTVRALSNLSAMLERSGELERALKLNREALAVYHTLGDAFRIQRHQCEYNLSRLVAVLEDPVEGVRLGLSSWEGLRATRGHEHPETLIAAIALGIARAQAGEYEKAIDILEPTLRGLTAKAGAENENTINGMLALAIARRAAGEPETAVKLCDRALRRWRARWPDHWMLGVILVEYGRSLAALPTPRRAQAQRALRRGVAILDRKLGNDHLKTRDARLALAALDGGEAK